MSASPGYRLLQRRRQTGSIGPRPHGGGQKPAFDATVAERLRQAVADRPDATLMELRTATGVACGTSALHRMLAKLGLPRNKSERAAEQDDPDLKAQRQAWQARMRPLDAGRFVFLDETGSNTTMARRFGRAPRGERVDGPVPQGHWKSVTLTAAIRLGGVGGCLAFDGATDSAMFEDDIARVLVPTLRPGDIVVMDNLSAHKGLEVERLVRAAGAEVSYLPPDSPDFNPIEKMFSKPKTLLRGVGVGWVSELYDAMSDALRAVTEQDIAGWFRSCGYSTPKREPL